MRKYIVRIRLKGNLRWAALILGAALWALPVRAGEIHVFAAASLKNALDDCIAAYAAKHTDDKILASYAASSALAKQIEAGAPADLFVSADTDWMDYLDQRQLVDRASRVDLLGNEIVLIAPVSSVPGLAIAPGFGLAAALGDGRLALADPDFVPAGKYAKAALTTLGVWDSVADKLARAENVRVALAFVARGEAPLGIVYATDAKAEKRVAVVGIFPTDSHPPIVYPAALIRDHGSAAAAAFLTFLKSPEASTHFREQGFKPVDGR